MSKVVKSTVWLMIAMLIAKVLGFGREIVLAATYGTSIYSDIYITAMNIPVIIFTAIGTSLGTTFIPLYFEVQNEKEEKDSLKFANNTFNIVMILSVILAIIGIIFAEPIVKIFAMGFKGESFVIAVKFTRILMLGTIFIGLSYVMTAYLQVKNEFFIPGIASTPKNIIIILSMILSIKYGIYVMVWGTLVGMFVEFLFQVPFAYKVGYKYNLYISLKDKYLRKMMLLVAPVFVGVAVNQVNALVDRTLASTLIEGSISALNYANKLNGFVIGLIIVSIGSVIYPMLSKLTSDNNNEKFVESVANSVNSVVLLVSPISVGAIVLAKPIVQLLFERGSFDSNAVAMTSSALVFYSIGLLGAGLRDILSKVFYSLQDTKTPMINGTLTVVLNIVLNILLIKHFAHNGLALATSISSIICIVLLFMSLKKKIGYFGQDKIIKVMLKSFIASCIMGVCAVIIYNILNSIISASFIFKAIILSISILVGAIVYAVIIILLKVEEVERMLETIKTKIKRR